MPIATAAIQMDTTTSIILVMVTLCCLALVMQKTTQALSIVIAVRNQIVAMAETTEIKP